MSGLEERPGIAVRPVVRRGSRAPEAGHDRVAVEEPLEIRIGDVPLAVTMRTPGHDEELAAGFCWTEGIVRSEEELAAVRPCARAEWGNVVEVELGERAAHEHRERTESARRDLYLSSSCGLCGKQSIDRISQAVERLPPGLAVPADLLPELPGRMRDAQDVFAATGGLHAAALFGGTGELRVLREDVGRHNAVDKAIGHELLLGRFPLHDAVLLVSGRAGFEIVQKAAMARIPVLCAVSAPSSLAIDLATRLDVTLVGFLRDGRMNVYHDPGRLAAPSPSGD